LEKIPTLDKLDDAVKKEILSKEESEMVRETEEARLDVILVDEFTLEEYDTSLPSPPDGDGLQLEKAKMHSV
jgi:hypothetical protein